MTDLNMIDLNIHLPYSPWPDKDKRIDFFMDENLCLYDKKAGNYKKVLCYICMDHLKFVEKVIMCEKCQAINDTFRSESVKVMDDYIMLNLFDVSLQESE